MGETVGGFWRAAWSIESSFLKINFQLRNLVLQKQGFFIWGGDLQHIRFVITKRERGGFGFFKYAHELAGANPPHPLKQIFSLMRSMCCDFLVEETLEPDELCKKEISELEKLSPSFKPLRRVVKKLSFFTSKSKDFAPGDSEAEFVSLCKANDLVCLGFTYLYLDYSGDILLSAYVPKAVVKSFVESSTKYVHSKSRFRNTVCGESFLVRGSYFIQQEGSAWCCAHAALLVSLHNIFAAIGKACPIDFTDINNALFIDNFFRKGSSGLYIFEIQRILESVGLAASVLAPCGKHDCPSDADARIAAAYYCVESGLPAIIGFAGSLTGHVMAVVGHTFDPNLWSARATGAYFHSTDGYLQSHGWVGELIVQDDNFGPYCTLPRAALWEKRPVVVLPKFPWSDKLTPMLVERVAAVILSQPPMNGKSYFHDVFSSHVAQDLGNSNFWFHELIKHVSSKTYVLRTLPITPQNYIASVTTPTEDGTIIDAERDFDPNIILMRLGKKNCWMVEVSVPELYQRNERRLAEILIQQGNNGDPELKVVRLPGVMSVASASSGFTHRPIQGKYHYPIYKLEDHPLKALLPNL